MIAEASSLDLLTTPYVFSEDDAVAMTEAGADIIVCHMGLTTGGSIGAETALTLDDCVERIDAWADAARSRARRRDRALPRRPDRHARTTRPTCCSAVPTSTASTAHRAWSGCRPNSALTAQTEAFKAITF